MKLLTKRIIPAPENMTCAGEKTWIIEIRARSLIDMLRSHPWWVLHGARLCLLCFRIGLSHCCVMGLVSWSCGLHLLVLCCHIMSRHSPWPSLMHGVVLVCCLLLLTDWVDVRAMPWSWVFSIGEWLIDVSCDSLLAWYFVSHDGLVLYLLQLTLVSYYTTIPNSFCTWFTVL